MTLAQATQDALLDWLLGTAFPTPPEQLYLAVHSGPSPSLDNEISGWAGGDRLRVTASDFAPAADAAGDGRQRSNSRALLLGIHTLPQTIASFGLWDAATGGNLILNGVIDPVVELEAGNPPVFLVGALALQAV
jgi:hypothetical protein